MSLTADWQVFRKPPPATVAWRCDRHCTPGDVGNKREPQIFMKPGDVYEIVVDAIGALRNTIRDE